MWFWDTEIFQLEKINIFHSTQATNLLNGHLTYVGECSEENRSPSSIHTCRKLCTELRDFSGVPHVHRAVPGTLGASELVSLAPKCVVNVHILVLICDEILSLRPSFPTGRHCQMVTSDRKFDFELSLFVA